MCKQKYSIYKKEAVVIDGCKESTFIKETNEHQFPIPPLNRVHQESHSSSLANWSYNVDSEHINIVETHCNTTVEPEQEHPHLVKGDLITPDKVIERKDRQGRWVQLNIDVYLSYKFRFV